MNEIILADCLSVLPQIPEESIGAVICDPPYNISNEVKISRNSQGKYKGNDITSDFGAWDHFESEEDYIKFTVAWALECGRVLVPGGFLVSFFDKKRLSLLPDILEPAGMRTRDVVTWVKNNPVPQVRKVKFAQATEMAMVLSKPGPNRFQWQNGYHPNYKKAPIVGGKERLKDEDGKTLHMTQKPESIIKWLMDYYSMPGDTILDPFSGTGTTAVVAVRSGRNYICVEAEERYYSASLERIAGVQMDLLSVDYKDKSYRKKWL